jgi:M6 family metalloprotease-like protein
MSGSRRSRGRWAAIALALLLGASAVHAAPRYGEIRPVLQPDGSIVELRVWGDEFYTVAESLDGFTAVRDPVSGFACYALLAPDGDSLVSTGMPIDQGDPVQLGLTPGLRINAAAARAAAQAARTAAERAWGPAPQPLRGSPPGTASGNVVGICLIVDFSDEVGTITPAQVEAFCNQIGYTGFGNNGSVRDYYHDVSGGVLNYTQFVPTAYYRASQPKSYYMDPAIPWGQRACELIIEALEALDATGFDFSQYDSDGNGRIDAINLFYAGYSNTVWIEGLWPGSGGLSYSADGVSAERCQWTDMGGSLGIGTYCHENGHMLMHWPDLYDYDYDSAGVGRFCLMANYSDAENPVQPCAYLKLAAGWANVTELAGVVAGAAVPAAGNIVYRIAHPTRTREYYLIENRQRTGRDAALPDHGLALWHIDEDGSNDWNEMTTERHYLVTLVQADGRWDLENDRNQGDSTDLWAAPTYTRCAPQTNPSPFWWDGAPTHSYITEISASAATMYFNFSTSIWVDFGYVGTEEGTFVRPYNTLFEGVSVVEHYGTIKVRAGSSPETLTISKPMTIVALEGHATIGP